MRVLAALQRAFSSSSTTNTTATAADASAEALKPTSSSAKGLKGTKGRKSREGEGVPSLTTRPSLPDDVVTGYGRGKVEEGIVRSWAVRGEMESGREKHAPTRAPTPTRARMTPTAVIIDADARDREDTPAPASPGPGLDSESQLDRRQSPGQTESHSQPESREQPQSQSAYDWDAFKRERVERRSWFKSGEGEAQGNESVVAVVGAKKKVLRRRTRTRKGE